MALDLQERYHTCVASAREFDPREIGLLYYVMASSLTLGDALKRVARYSQITNEALVVRYLEGNKFIIRLHYSGVPRHMDRHQIEFFMFAASRLCRVLVGSFSQSEGVHVCIGPRLLQFRSRASKLVMSCRWPGKSTKRIRLPSASTITAIFVVRRWPDFEFPAPVQQKSQGRQCGSGKSLHR